MTGGPSLTSQGLGDSVATTCTARSLLLVMDRPRLLPDEAYLEPPGPSRTRRTTSRRGPGTRTGCTRTTRATGTWTPTGPVTTPTGSATWTDAPVMAATASSRYSIGARYDQGVSAQGAPTPRPGIPPGQAVLALLTAATARLVYGYSHTYQRRAQQHWRHRRARQRRRRQERRRHQH